MTIRKTHLDAHEEGDGEGADDEEEGDGRQEHWGRNGKGVHENEPILEKQLLTASTSGLLSLRLIWPPASRKPTWGICCEQTGCQTVTATPTEERQEWAHKKWYMG